MARRSPMVRRPSLVANRLSSSVGRRPSLAPCVVRCSSLRPEGSKIRAAAGALASLIGLELDEAHLHREPVVGKAQASCMRYDMLPLAVLREVAARDGVPPAVAGRARQRAGAASAPMDWHGG